MWTLSHAPIDGLVDVLMKPHEDVLQPSIAAEAEKPPIARSRSRRCLARRQSLLGQ
jgi:hypothetical protein